MRATIKSLGAAACAAVSIFMLSHQIASAQDAHARSKALLRQMAVVNQQAMAAIKVHDYRLAQQLNNDWTRLQKAYSIVLKNENIAIGHNDAVNALERGQK